MKNNMMYVKFRTQVSAVIVVIDDFTNRIVSASSVRVSLNIDKKPLRKEGYFIFTDLAEGNYILKIEGNQYQRREVELPVHSDMEAGEPVMVRVIPNRAYPLPPGTTTLSGKSVPGSRIQIVCTGLSGSYKLLYEYDKKNNENEIRIFHKDNLELSGRSFCIREKKKKQQEIFQIKEVLEWDDKRYLLDQPLNSNYRKADAEILPVYTAYADEKGEFFSPLADAAGCEIEYFTEQDMKNMQSCKLEAGKENRLIM